MVQTFHKSHKRDVESLGFEEGGFYVLVPDRAMFHLKMALQKMEVGVEVGRYSGAANF